MKGRLVIGLAVVAAVVVFFYGVVFVRPIFPGACAGIVYPAPGARVPPEFSVEGVAASWSFGVEFRRLLGPSTTYASLAAPPVSLVVDGAPCGSSGGGNHHIYSLRLPEGPHTIRLLTPSGEDSINVNVSNDLPVRFERVDDAAVARYTEAARRLRAALEEYLSASPPPVGSDVPDAYRQIYLTDGGAFVFMGTSKDRRFTSCDVRFVGLAGAPPRASDIASAVPFTWDEREWERPVRISAAAACGDRFLFLVIDTDSLTIFYIYPDGAAARASYRLPTLSPELSEALAANAYTEVVVNGNRGYGVLRIWAGNSFFYLVIDNGALLPATDAFSATEALILENGGMIRGGWIYSEYSTFESIFSEKPEGSPLYLPLPDGGETYSFDCGYPTVGSVEFFDCPPRFDIRPLVPEEDPADSSVRAGGGPVRFPPGIIESTVGDRHGYFRVVPQDESERGAP